MTVLYTVRLRQKKKISVFDSRGKWVRDDEQEIVVPYTRLPARTAEMYRRTCPDAFIDMVAEDPREHGVDPTRNSYSGYKSATVKKKPKQAERSQPKPSKQRAPNAGAGTYADVVNKMTREGAA